MVQLQLPCTDSCHIVHRYANTAAEEAANAVFRYTIQAGMNTSTRSNRQPCGVNLASYLVGQTPPASGRTPQPTIVQPRLISPLSRGPGYACLAQTFVEVVYEVPHADSLQASYITTSSSSSPLAAFPCASPLSQILVCLWPNNAIAIACPATIHIAIACSATIHSMRVITIAASARSHLQAVRTTTTNHPPRNMAARRRRTTTGPQRRACVLTTRRRRAPPPPPQSSPPEAPRQSA
eukprot:366552-Chlamydomonas_euryale.AAC.16